jgi:phage N-6-adenine-methyltransferase
LTTLPQLVDHLSRDSKIAEKRLEAWLAKENKISGIAKLAKQLSAAQESLKRCRDGETITLRLQNQYASAKLRCQRRGGELLAAMKKHNGGRPSKNGNRPHDGGGLSIQDHLCTETKKQAEHISHRWQKIAEVPPEQFEELVNVDSQTERDVEITAASVLRNVHVSNNTGYNEWYTPEKYISAARHVLMEIDLDPSSSLVAQKIIKAKRFYTVDTDGLSKEWSGNTWMNPPYGRDTCKRFIDKLVAHYRQGDIPQAIVLSNNATETDWFHKLCEPATMICFCRGRISFLNADGKTAKSPLQGQAFVYLGSRKKRFYDAFRKFGLVTDIIK